MEGLLCKKQVGIKSSSTRTNPYRICGVYCPDIWMNIAYGVSLFRGLNYKKKRNHYTSLNNLISASMILSLEANRKWY